jgi:uncharacterized protein YbjT (DUF2867 family)
MQSPTTPFILVTGGTGTLGGHVITRLRAAGRDIRVLSRHRHASGDGIEYVTGDLLKGDGIEPAVDGAGIVVHCAGSARGDDVTTRNLVRAAARAGVQHLVYISVVGADRIPVVSGVDRAMFGYFASKLAAERVVADSGLPWTMLRATQFHELSLLTAQFMAKLPVLPLPIGFRFQPVAASEVATRLVELALGAPSGLVPDIGGPRVYRMDEMLREYLWAAGKRRPLIPVWIPGNSARAIRAGANLTQDRAVGRQTWEEFLADKLRSSSESRSRQLQGAH